VLQSPDKHVKEIDEGKFNQSSEDRHEANDDEHIQGCGITNLYSIQLVFTSAEPTGKEREGAFVPIEDYRLAQKSISVYIIKSFT
jgi:hypothetical protein